MKERILQGALELFLKYGIKSVTMDDIASHLSVSKKTIYQHYTDKNKIVVLSCKLYMEKEKIDIQAIHKESKNAVDEMVRVSKYIKQNIAHLNPSILFDIKKYHPEAWDIFTAHKEECVMGTIKQNLEEGQVEGYYHKDFNTAIMTRLRMTEGEMAFNPSVFPPTEFDLTEVHMQLFNHFLRGILTSKGLELWNQLNQEN